MTKRSVTLASLSWMLILVAACSGDEPPTGSTSPPPPDAMADAPQDVTPEAPPGLPPDGPPHTVARCDGPASGPPRAGVLHGPLGLPASRRCRRVSSGVPRRCASPHLSSGCWLPRDASDDRWRTHVVRNHGRAGVARRRDERSCEVDPLRAVRSGGDLPDGTSGGRWRSEDGGASWKGIAQNILVVHPRRSDVVYGIDTEGLPMTMALTRSVDGGATWTSTAVPASLLSSDPDAYIGKTGLLIDPGNEERIYLWTTLQRSSQDQWVTVGRWTPSAGTIEPVVMPSKPSLVDPIAAWAVGATGELYAGGTTLSRSDDQGRTWTALTRPGMGTLRPVAPLEPSVDLVYGVANGPVGTPDRVHVSRDRGVTWSEPRELPASPSNVPLSSAVSRGLTVVKEGRLVITEPSAVQLSSDDGSTWTRQIAYVPLGPGSLLASGDRVLLSTAGVEVRSDDGLKTWETIGRGAHRLYPDVNDDEVVYGTLGLGSTTQRSSDRGVTWTPWPVRWAPFSGSSPIETGFRTLAVAPGDSRVLLARVEQSARSAVSVIRSSDGGATWAVVQRVAEYDPTEFAEENNVVFAPGDANVAYAAGRGIVYHSTDGGMTWAGSRVWPDIDPPTTKETDIIVLAADPADAAVVYAAGRAGIWRSLDGGSTWADVTSVLTLNSFATLDASGGAPGEVVVGATRGCYKSTDRGATWKLLSSGLPPDSTYCRLVRDRKLPATLYAMTTAGLFKSTTDGE